MAGSVYAVVAVGFNVVESATRLFNFAHGDLVTLAPMVVLIAIDYEDVPIWLALILGVVACVVASVIIERLCMRRFESRPDSFGWILTTLGASVIIEQALAAPFQAQPVALGVHLSMGPLDAKGVLISAQDILIIGLAIAMLISILALLRWTALGATIRAVGQDRDGARSIGLRANRAAIGAMVIAGIAAGGIGIAYAPLTLITPDFGFGLTFFAFIAAALGGIGSVPGAIIGGYAVGLIIQLTAIYVGSVWTDTVLFGLLVVLYSLRPRGIMGRRAERLV